MLAELEFERNAGTDGERRVRDILVRECAALGRSPALEVARHFVEHPPGRELRLVLFSGEELGLLGSYAYVTAHEEEVRSRGRVVVNLDLAGDPIGMDSLIVVGTREQLGDAGGTVAALEVWPNDCMPFAVHEVPSVNVARTDGRASHHIHTPGDVASNVSAGGLEHPVRAVLGAEIFLLRREIDDTLRERIEKYLYDSTLEKPELRWLERCRK